MKITILGGAGFIGTSLIERLVKEGHSLRVYEKPNAQKKVQYESIGIEWIESESSSFADIEKSIEGAEIVIHLASSTLPHSSNLDPILDVQQNLIPSIHLLEAMVKNRVSKFIFISSGGTVYGKPHYLPIEESHPTDPIVSYGIIKLAIEKYALMYQSIFGLRTIILRVSNPYGPLQKISRSQGAIRIFIDKVLKNENVEIWGDGTTTRDYIYIDDLVDAIHKTISYSGKISVFNIGTGVGSSLNRILDLIGLELNEIIQPIYKAPRQMDVKSNILNIELAKSELQWAPSTNLSEGIKKMTAFIKNHQDEGS
jgi:UDP-glucose 4-epimerase